MLSSDCLRVYKKYLRAVRASYYALCFQKFRYSEKCGKVPSLVVGRFLRLFRKQKIAPMEGG